MSYNAKKKDYLKGVCKQATGWTFEKTLCRKMKHIQEDIKELSKEVKSLRNEVSKGKGAISVLVFLGMTLQV